jgi:hypothetical protein
MCFAVPCAEYKPNPVLARAMDRIFTLHADHEQNASTSTVRLAGSTGANPFACIAAGIACLWGPAHGGVNEAALKILGEIGSVERIPDFIRRAKDPKDAFRLMGFGHQRRPDQAGRSCQDSVERVCASSMSAVLHYQGLLALERSSTEDGITNNGQAVNTIGDRDWRSDQIPLVGLKVGTVHLPESRTRAFYARSDLDLILSSPASAAKVHCGSIAAMAVSICWRCGAG